MKISRAPRLRVLFALIVMCGGSVAARSQADDDWPSLSYLRSDYRAVVAVAHVNVTKAEIVGRIGGYENWRIVCSVVEPLKGKLKRGAELEYFHGAEAGFRTELFMGEKIVFLLHDYDRGRGRRIYTVLENSTLKYNRDLVRKLRVIAHSSRRRRTITR